MSASRRDRIAAVLNALHGRPPEEHEALLAECVGEDEDLRRSVLARFERARRRRELRRDRTGDERVPALRREGDRIGPYRLVSLLGRGGMGEVWLAEREDGHFQQQVALKLVAPGPSHGETLERFRRERQVLADLDHEGIARLLDGGATPDGLPYYVMEYVDGEPIDVHCRRQELDVRDRIALFLQVCEAVSHAHARLVVHRDLKPGNVLVTPRGTAKLLDFGIAKLLDVDEAPSLLTLAGQRCLTPRYASPEQMRGDPVGTASDVYSLGVLLYELLCDRSPYRPDLSASELHEAICESVPRRPSTRVLETVGPDGAHSARAPQRARRLRGDLDNIVMAALRKERDRRYGSVEALAEDLRRHLDGRPVRARPSSTLYLASRFVRRHRWSLLAGATVIASLAAALIVSTRLYLQAERQRQEATLQAYAASIAAVDAALGNEHRVLDAQERLAAAPPELRGWEWELQRSRLDRALLSVATERNALAVGLSPDGRRVASFSAFPGDPGLLEVWDTSSGERLLAVEGHEAFARDLDFSPDGRRVATVSSDHSVHVWDLAEARVQLAIDPGLGALACGAFDPAGGRIAVGGREGPIAVLDAATGATLLELPGHLGAVSDLRFTADGARLLSAGRDGTAREWDVADGRELRRFPVDGAPIALAFDALADRLVLLTAEGRALRLRLSDGARLSDVEGPPLVVDRGALSSDGRYAAVPCADRCVRVWETQFGDVVGELRGNTDNAPGVWGLAFGADGLHLATSTWDRSVRLWDLRGTPSRLELRAHSAAILDLAAHPDGERLASCSRDGTVRLWNARAGLLLRTLRGHTGQVRGVDFSPSGDRLVSVAEDGAIVWQPDTGALLEHVEPPVRSARYAPGQDLLALGSSEGRILLRSPGSERTLRGPAGEVLDLGFSADGRQLGSLHSATRDQGGGHLILWDVATGSELARHDSALRVHSFELLPGGEGVLLGGVVAKRARVDHLGLPGLVGVTSWDFPNAWSLGRLAVSPDGERVAVPTSLSALHLWDPGTRRELLTLRDHGAIVWTAAWSPDGAWLASGSSDLAVHVWSTRAPAEDRVPSLVRTLFERHGLADEVVAALEGLDGLTPGERDHALRIVRSRVDDLAELRRTAEDGAWGRNAGPWALRRGLDAARALLRARPGDSDAELMEGVLLYRRGALREACERLRRALGAGDGPAAGTAPTAALFLSMTRCRLDEPGAREELARLVERLERDHDPAGPTRGALGEARHLLAGG